MSDNIQVAIKVRPVINREGNEPLQWSVSGNTITPTDSKRRGEAGFQFDHIFDMDKKNEEIFHTVVKPIVNAAVNGFNGTVFAYGQTGSGKTYTMMGTEMELGIIPLAIAHMFDAIENTTGREFLIRFSYFEIYNEKINDLLEVENSDLKIKEENGRVFVNKCSEKVTKGPKHMLTAMERGEKNRSIGETNMNERSSRSHTIFRITIESREISSDSDGAIQISQLNLVDLAGSEKVSQTGATGDRFKEGKHINLSLSTLGLVIKQLSESQDKDRPNFVNFRDSKLTRILQASLGGNSLTVIICTVTPATFEETQCTLSFASRAKSIKNKPKLNEDLSDEALLKRYKKQILELTKELEKANKTIKDRQNNVLADRVELLREYIVTGNGKGKNFRRRSCPVKFSHETIDSRDHSFRTKLPSIRESFSPETPKYEKIKRRQSIIQNATLANENFETALADFEIELLQSELPPDEDFFICTRRPIKHRVQFDDNPSIFEDTRSTSYDDSPTSISSTPRRRCNCTNTSSPGTPKSVLRERLKTVIEEHVSLEEFTTLEKQLNRDEVQSMNLDDNEKSLRNLKKSLEDTYILYSDVNKKYSDIQTEHSQLKEECVKLKKQVVSLSAVQDRLGRMEIENKELHTKLNAALKKQKFLEDENVSQAFQMESMQAKFKSRENELELSLQHAWKVGDPAQAKETSNEILRLQDLVKTLTGELELLNSEKSLSEEMKLEKQRLNDELEEFKSKFLEAEEKKKDFENQALKLEVKEMELLELNEKFIKLDAENLEIKSKLQETTNKLNNYENGVEFLRVESQFESKLIEKEAEFYQANMKVIQLEAENSEIKSNLCEAMQKLKDYEFTSQNVVEKEIELTNKLKQVEEENSLIKDKLSQVEEKMNVELMFKLAEKETEISELSRKLNEFEGETASLISKLEEAGEKLKNYESIVEATKVEKSSIEYLESKLSAKEVELNEMAQKSNEFERINSEMKSQLLEVTVKLQDYVTLVDSLKSNEKESEITYLTSRMKELEDENSEMKFKLEAVDHLENNENVNFTLDSRLEEKEAEISHLSVKINELGAENFELKSKLEEAEESLTNYKATVESLKCDIDQLNAKLQEKEIVLSHLNARYKELLSMNSSLTKSKSMNSTSEDPFANFKSDIDFVETYLAENDAIKKRLENFEKNVSIFRENVDEQKTFVEGLEKDNIVNNEIKDSPTVQNRMSTPSKTKKVGDQTTPKSVGKLFNDENDSISIFTNDTYFENMNVSGLEETIIENETQNETRNETQNEMRSETQNEAQNESQEFTAPSMMINILKSNDVPILKKRIKELETRNEQMDILYKQLIEKVNEGSSEELANALKEFKDAKISLEIENARLGEDLQQKIQESKEIQNGISGLKMDIEKLQQTIYLLNTENLDLTCKLNVEKQKNTETEDLKNSIEELQIRTSQINEEKVNLEKEISLLNAKIVSLQSTIPIASEEKIKSEVVDHQQKIEVLETENRKLTVNLMEKIRELDSLKECKALEFDHECTYKDRNEVLLKENNALQNEITELSDDLMKHIDENESTKQELDTALKKLAIYETTPSPKSSESPENIKLALQEKKRLEAEVVELKSKVTQLSNENTEFTSNLSVIFDDLEKNSEADNSCRNSLSSANLESQSRRVSNNWRHDENVQLLNNKIKTLEEQVEHLTLMNRKLSDLKLNSCTQCAHLKELNENRRALKLEVKSLNNKLEDLQTKFKEKCANTEVLRLKASEELNTSTGNVTLSTSISEGINISVMEENIRILSSEKETLKEEYEKLANLYQEKCSDLETLQESQLSSITSPTSPASPMASSKKGERISKIESAIQQVGTDLQQQKEKLSNLSSELQKFKELKDKLKVAEESAVTAEEKVKLLETEIANLYENMKKLNESEKMLKTEKLNLEVEFESFKVESLGNKKYLIAELEVVKEEKEQLLARQKYEDSNREAMEATLKEYRESIEDSEKRIKEISVNLSKSIKENQDLNNEITRLKSRIEEKIDSCKVESAKEEENNVALKELESQRILETQKELESAKQLIIKEMKSLTSEAQDPSGKSVSDLFQVFLSKSIKENQDLNNEITRLKSRIEEKIDSCKVESAKEEENNVALKELESQRILETQKELESAKQLIIKEMKSLTSEAQDPSGKSVSDLFQVFLKTIMSKEHEIIKTLKDRFDQEKLKLEEAKQQSEDAEKRANTWAKTLENDIEKLQSDLTLLEEKNADLHNQIQRLENGLEEIQHENQNLKEKMEVLEADYNALQIDYDKRCKDSLNQGEIENVIHERERMQTSIRDKEIELQSKMKAEKEEYNKKIGELTNAMKILETKNIDLKSSVDGLEANEKQLKSIIDIKTNELTKNNQIVKDLQMELEKIAEINNQLGEEILEKDRRIEEITSLLKNKCDTLSEYKTKLETIMPEYDNLRIQLEERKLSNEKYKEEIKTLRAETLREINLFKDKFMEEEIKSAGLNKQLNELDNKNGVLLQELDTARVRCLELEAENEKLVRKMRNSTSKLRVEKDMEELMDKNRTLENNLEGAYNRITEVQEARSKVMQELVDIKGKVELVKRENEELKKAVDAFKSRHNYSDIIELRAKYEELLQEKNHVKLELEEKKLLLIQRDKKLEEMSEKLKELEEKNRELDEEAEELAEVIRERGKENSDLEVQNLDLIEKYTKETEDLKAQLKNSMKMNTDLRAQIEIIRRTEVSAIQKENEELKNKIIEFENKIESWSCASSRSTSPMAEVNKRKKRRSDLFNQKRHLDEVSDSGLSSSSSDCQCSDLRKTVAELGKEISMKNGIIAALNVQIQSENFPYEKKCKDLKDELALQKNKTRQLIHEISNLKKAMMETSVQECDICKRWRLNQREQGVQCKIEEKIYLSGTSSGIVGEFKYIEKLEKEKALMRQLCRSRLAQIKQLETKLAELTTNT